MGEREPPSCLSLPAQPQPEPPTGAGGLQRQRAIEAPDPAGGGEFRRPKLFWDLQTQNLSAQTSPGGSHPTKEERVLGTRNQPPGLGLTHSNMQLHTRTHIWCSRCHTGTHTPTQVCVGTGVSCVRAHRVSLTHRCTYTLGTSHTHSPSCNTAGSSHTQHTYTRVHTHRLRLYFSGPEKEGGGWGLERTESSP